MISLVQRAKLAERMALIPHEFIRSVIWIIQIGLHESTGQKITPSESGELEVDFKDLPDQLIIKIAKFLSMIQKNKYKARREGRELEKEAKFQGFEDFGTKRKVLKQPPIQKVRPNPLPRFVSRPRISFSNLVSKSRSPASVMFTPTSKDTMWKPGSNGGSEDPSPKRTLSDSSSSSDSEAEPHAKKPPRSKRMLLKRTLSESSSSSDEVSLDFYSKRKLHVKKKIIPGTANKTSTLAVQNKEELPIPENSLPPASQFSEANLRLKQKQKHEEALKRQSEARRRRALEEKPTLQQYEIMQAFEKDFTY